MISKLILDVRNFFQTNRNQDWKCIFKLTEKTFGMSKQKQMPRKAYIEEEVMKPLLRCTKAKMEQNP
jgi:hypothetical protein